MTYMLAIIVCLTLPNDGKVPPRHEKKKSHKTIKDLIAKFNEKSLHLFATCTSSLKELNS